MKLNRLSQNILTLGLSFFLFFSLFSFPSSAVDDIAVSPLYQKPSVSAEQFVLMDAESGQILLEKNMNEIIHPASTTKIVTAYLALTSGILSTERVTASSDAISSIPRDTSHMAIDYGETLSFGDLLYGTLLASANDAANMLAEAVIHKDNSDLTFDDSISVFANKMNDFAVSCGAQNTNFQNPHGLLSADGGREYSGHTSTAFDMAMIFRQIIKNQTMLEIMNTVSYTVPATNKKGERNYITTGNLLLKSGEFNYPKCIGGKTGYTEKSGYSFVAAANSGSKTYIVALYNCSDGDSRFSDAIKLFDFAFDCFKEVEIPSSGLPRSPHKVIDGDYITGTATVYSASSIKVMLHISIPEDKILITDNTPENLNASELSASVTLSLADDIDIMFRNLGTYPLTVNVTPNATPIRIGGKEENSQNEKEPVQNDSSSPAKTVVLVILFIFLAALLTVILIYIYENINRQKKAKEKRRARLGERELLTESASRTNKSVQKSGSNSSKTEAGKHTSKHEEPSKKTDVGSARRYKD